MLERLLARVYQGGTLEIGRLATELGAPIELVEAMLEDLARRGLIQDFVRCADGCLGCGLRGSCATPNAREPRIWHGVV